MAGRDDDCAAISGDNGNDRDDAIAYCVVTAYQPRKRGPSCTLAHGARVAVRLSAVCFPMLTFASLAYLRWRDLTVLQSNRPVRTRMPGGVGGGAARLLPIPIWAIGPGMNQ